ncbi:hypothetical protein XELAEV_18030487mg [Xenopus laevis]|uniref:AAA+ ATPase domain-containing protein n=1 Tax=Xenopus laevis TaxID=8355 RepID=A0A974CKV9_XENLA|nr:hypothetical protein XELAEV_18030487mg [Xenopus laevis]
MAHKDKDGYSIFNLKLVHLYSEGNYDKMQFGDENQLKSRKVIMMVGETGSGKTTLINALINYILGVEWEDNYRYALIRGNTDRSGTQSQTSRVSIYQINHMEGFTIPYSLTIIDTPGFGSTEGREQDKYIAKQFQECFISERGVNSIDAICFVVKSSSIRLTKEQRYVFHSIPSLFGKDIKENILVCVTYADHSRPSVLEALTETQFPCVIKDGKPLYFKFNNSTESDDYHKDDEEDYGYSSLPKMLYDMGRNSSRRMFRILEELAPKSLLLTYAVLRERKAIEITMEGLLEKIKELTLKQHELNKTEQILRQHQEGINNNKNFKYEEKETIKQRKYVQGNAINCHVCESTCHYPCRVPANPVVALCGVFTWGRDCTVCGHGVSSHHREHHVFESEVVIKKKTYEELKQKYEKACKEKLSIEQRLHEISLKPDLLTVSDYIDLLIKKEQQEAAPGFEERIKSLKETKSKAEKIPLTAFLNA